MIVDKNMYVTRRSGACSVGRGRRAKKSNRNWFLIKHIYGTQKGETGIVRIGTISFPRGFIGKRIRLKIEIINGD